MKTLHLLRHAKASWEKDELRDADRHLTRRGKQDSARVARALSQSEHHFTRIYCSSARRCTETLQRFRAESTLFDGVETTIDDALYTFDRDTLLTWLKELDNSCTAPLIIGHNPALRDLVNYLYDGEIENFSTTTFITLEINVEYWDQLRTDSAKLTEQIRPKQLR